MIMAPAGAKLLKPLDAANNTYTVAFYASPFGIKFFAVRAAPAQHQCSQMFAHVISSVRTAVLLGGGAREGNSDTVGCWHLATDSHDCG